MGHPPSSFIAFRLMLVGVACLFWPHSLQNYAVKNSTNRLARINPFLDWMRTTQYIWSLRIVGFIAIAGGGLIIAVVTSGRK